MTEPVNRLNDETMRAFAMVAAGILLNLGLFFVLALFAPLVVGLICGYIVGHQRNGVIVGILSAMFSYSLVFIATGFATDLVVFSSAVLIMCIIGGVGGFIGTLAYKKTSKSSSQVSTMIRPGE